MFKRGWKSVLLAGAVAIAPAGASAAPQDANFADKDSASDASYASAKARMQREIDEAIAMVERIFETDKLPPVDPGRLALAQHTTATLVPAGSLEKMLDNLYGRLFRAVMEKTGEVSDMMLAIKTGTSSETIAALDPHSKAAIANLFDPHRKERDEQMIKIVRPLISEVLRDLETPMREGLAKAYARKFSAAQLGELNSFFATPTGGVYASEWMALQADPEVMVAMIRSVPPLIVKFIDRAPQLQSRFKDFPKAKELDDLSDAELDRLARLMKIDVAALKESRDEWGGQDGSYSAGDDQESGHFEGDSEGYPGAAASGFAQDRLNWLDADRKRVAALEMAADAANEAFFDAEQKAIANARQRLGNAPPSP